MMAMKANPDWPVVKSYDPDHLARIALPIGGIGTGTVSLGGRGDLRDWEVVNRPAKGFTPENCFFALWARPVGGPAAARAIEGPISPGEYEGSHGAEAANHGLPRFRQCRFAAAYPLGQVMLADRDVPLAVRIEAFNPLIPADAEASGIPVAVLRFVLINRTRRRVAASVCGSLLNFIGADGTGAPLGWANRPDHTALMTGNHNEARSSRGIRGVFLYTREKGTGSQEKGTGSAAKRRCLSPSPPLPSADEPPFPLPLSTDERFGTMALATTAGGGVTHRVGWAKRSWGGSILEFWEDFAADGRLDEPAGEAADPPTASLAARVTVPPRGRKAVTFLLAWHFPNRRTWTPAKRATEADRVGNHYARQYADAWDVAERTARRLGQLERRTVAFVRAVCESGLPTEVAEAALVNLTALRTQTSFRTADGRFFGWEGCCDTCGCCHGSCTHVWNYEQATAHLFGELAASMREVEFEAATGPSGHMSFRVNLPLSRARGWKVAAADGQMGCLMKLYRDWQLSGDEGLLRRLWPAARRAMEFCWVEGGWDADRDGVMEGCQHNTMDVEYYGPNPQMGTWYLGALRACEEMARHLGEADFADTCHRLFDSGSRWMDEHLFNGEYYEHEIRPPGGAETVADGLRHASMGARDLSEPELQLGAGCLVDQLVGQYFAHVCGLGYLLRPAHVRQTLRSILKYNLRRGVWGHFNHRRSFMLGDERGLLMASYPRGRRPRQPFPYETEVMTGFEYTAAVGMLQEGLTDEGLECIRAIRERYDGRKRSPFDEAECGHHYARAMASWAALLTLTGFHYSGARASMTFAPAGQRGAKWFWSTGRAWGVVEQKRLRSGIRVTLSVLGGRVRLRRVTLTGAGAAELPRSRTLRMGHGVTVLVKAR